MIRSSLGHFLAVAAFVLMILVPVHAADEPPGILWETTSQTVMEGAPMQMPVNRSKVCAPREWTAPPPGGDQSCTSSNFRRNGLTATWSVQCTGAMAMNGEGEITFDSDMNSYSGQVKLAAEEMKLTIKLTGKKVGTCDNPR